MNFNRFTMLAVAALVTAASTGAFASVYDDAFSQDTNGTTAQVSSKASEVQASQAESKSIIQNMVKTMQDKWDFTGSYATYQKETDTENYLTLQATGEGQRSFGLYRQGHGATGDGVGPSCTVNGVAKRSKNGYTFTQKKSPMGDSCQLEFRLIPGGIEVRQEGACMYYCGAGMELDKAFFSLDNHTPSK